MGWLASELGFGVVGGTTESLVVSLTGVLGKQ
jgi:hypothetical protein